MAIHHAVPLQCNRELNTKRLCVEILEIRRLTSGTWTQILDFGKCSGYVLGLNHTVCFLVSFHGSSGRVKAHLIMVERIFFSAD